MKDNPLLSSSGESVRLLRLCTVKEVPASVGGLGIKKWFCRAYLVGCREGVVNFFLSSFSPLLIVTSFGCTSVP